MNIVRSIYRGLKTTGEVLMFLLAVVVLALVGVILSAVGSMIGFALLGGLAAVLIISAVSEAFASAKPEDQNKAE